MTDHRRPHSLRNLPTWNPDEAALPEIEDPRAASRDDFHREPPPIKVLGSDLPPNHLLISHPCPPLPASLEQEETGMWLPVDDEPI